MLRASYSILSKWASGDWQGATEMYFRLKEIETPPMKFGKDKHKEWEKEVNKNKRFPEVFGGREIGKFETELKVEKKLTDWLMLVGVIDLWLPEEATVVDWKTGVISSEQYSNSFQMPVYQILKPEAKRFEFHRLNQYNKKVDMSIGYLTEKTLSSGIDWVITHASEMHSYFEENGLYDRFGNREPSKKG